MVTVKEPSTIVEAAEKSNAIKPGVFSGMLQKWQQTAYSSLVHAGIVITIAHKIATDYGSDMGRMMATDGKFKSKIGKLNDDGERLITMMGKAAVKTSNSMSIVFVAQTLDQLFKEELLASRKLPNLSPELQDYIQSCEEWANKQTWNLPKE